MLTIFKRISWFEWLWLGAAIIGTIVIHSAVSNILDSNRDLTVSNTTLKQEKTQVAQALKVEQRSAAITDDVVFEYTFERELKISEIDTIRSNSLQLYFLTRDQPIHVLPKEPGHELPKTIPTQPKTTAMVVTNPDPAAIAVLARGMRDVYCTAYRDPDTCTTKDTENTLHSK